MSSARSVESTSLDLYNINQNKIPDENNSQYINNTLLYPIAKAFLESYPQYSDIIRTYEYSVESISEIVGKDAVLDEYITIDNSTFVNFKCNVENVRIYSPDSYEAYQFSNFGYVPTPNIALAEKGLYSAVIVGDLNYSYSIYHKTNNYNSYIDIVNTINSSSSATTFNDTIKDGYRINMPIPMGCKWCSLLHYDPLTLIKSAEEMKSMFGFFIVDGFLRYIVPVYRKPFNRPIVLKNNFEEQLSRTETIYTKGYEYENSYYIVGVMVIPKSAHTGRSGTQASLPDFGFSLQLNHPTMNTDNNFSGKKSKKLINFVPIKYLFSAFGCVTDEELIKFICPQMDNFGLINTIRQACLQGYKHKEIVKNASIKLKSTGDYLVYAEPMTEFTSKYIIGTAILSQKTKDDLLSKCNNNEDDYKELVVQTVSVILDERFMPGIGDKSTVDRNTAVCTELGTIIKSLYEIGYDLEVSQDRASLTNRRVRNGQQMTREFKAFHGVRLREIFNEVKSLFVSSKDPRVINQILRSKMTTLAKNISINQSKSLINAFKGTSKEQSKIRTELVELKNQAFVWNRLREIVISTELKVTGSTVSWDHRMVHQSELFFICPTQTPESGANTGRFKTPTLYTFITLFSKGEGILKIVQDHKDYVSSIRLAKNPESMYVIRLNGSIIGYIPQYEPVESLYKELMDARFDNKIEFDASITLNNILGTLSIWTDTGRIMSPFVIIKNAFDIKVGESNGKPFDLPCTITPKKEFKEWLSRCSTKIDQFYDGFKLKFIELMDPEMAITNAVIAPSMKELLKNPIMYSHVALPNHIHGIIASLVPAINLNTGVRASYLTNHVKQAIGPVLRYPQLKYIGENNILIAPQVPLVRPCTYNYLHMNETPIGHNVIVAFMQSKYNQADAIMMNRCSVEQGLLKIDSLVTKEYKIDHNDEEFKVPDDKITLNGNPDSYSKLDPSTALPKFIGDQFFQNDALIGKVNISHDGETDTSILNERPDGKYPVSANTRPLRCIVKNKYHMDNKVMKKVVFGQYRVPIVGDKFNSEHAQKGTCGKIVDPEHMPYNSTGMRPDIVFNPPSVFKRKTFGHIYIPMIAKLAALLGCPIDCTPYHTIRSDEDLFKIFKELGLNDAGYETMYDPDTGRAYKSKIFFANHYWERQSHLVEQKLNVRNGGPRVVETGQPMKGRKHHGGQSVDRMTFDCHIASGICEMIRDVHLNQGSKIKIGICNRCRTTMGYFHGERKEWVCPNCGAHPDFIIREVPPASALMVHIFNGLHISIDYIDHLDDLEMNVDKMYMNNEKKIESSV